MHIHIHNYINNKIICRLSYILQAGTHAHVTRACKSLVKLYIQKLNYNIFHYMYSSHYANVVAVFSLFHLFFFKINYTNIENTKVYD